MLDAVGVGTHVAELYGHVGRVRMVLVSGSYARGLADDSSDLDLYIYVADLDTATNQGLRLLEGIGARFVFELPTRSGAFEKYRLDGQFVDVETIDVAVLKGAAEDLEQGRLDSNVVKVAAGLRDAHAIVGEEELRRWRERLRYTDTLAVAEVSARLPRLVPPGVLYELTFARGDVLSFSARVSRVMLDSVALLAAANRRFVPVEDPKWMPWHIEGLTDRPDDFIERIEEALVTPSRETARALDRLVEQVLDIVDERVPGVDTRAARFALRLPY